MEKGKSNVCIRTRDLGRQSHHSNGARSKRKKLEQGRRKEGYLSLDSKDESAWVKEGIRHEKRPKQIRAQTKRKGSQGRTQSVG